ncbi:MAG TPA: hypothetical protein VKA92_01105, partial [Segetibacter sp.]|nr:hypothetical protein [Segetibacter sp.]
FFVKGDAKGLAAVHTAKNEDLLVATQNQDSLIIYTKAADHGNTDKWINLNSNDLSADIIYSENKKMRTEFYYGSTFLSQSSRKMKIDKNAQKIVITDFKGNKREFSN